MKAAQLAQVPGEDERPRTRAHALELAAAALEAMGEAFRALALDAADVERASKDSAIRVQDLAARWGVGESSVYDLINRKHLRAFRVGTSVCIPLREVLNYERRRTT